MICLMKSDNAEPYTPECVLAVGAHPDDIDFTASGTIAAWAKAGAHIEYLIITDGSKGSDDPDITSEELIKLREAEQREAAKILGAQNVRFLHYPDGQLEVTQKLKMDIAAAIRAVKPDTVIVMDPTVLYSSERGFINHPDHRAAGQATLDAIYPLARDHLSFPELLQQGLEPHKVAHVLLTNFEKQNCFVDITETFDLKLAGLLAHKSQVHDTEKVGTMLRAWAKTAGEKAGFGYAEGFMRIDVPA